MDSSPDIGERLRELRQDASLTQEDVAILAGTTEQTVGNWETRATIPGPRHIQRLAEVYGQTIAAVRGEEEPRRLSQEERYHLEQDRAVLLREWRRNHGEHRREKGSRPGGRPRRAAEQPRE